MSNTKITLSRLLLICFSPLFTSCLIAQSTTQRLQKAFQQFEADTQLRHAISSLYVIDAKTGELVFEKNSQIGLAGASTQKIITAATAFELLGKDYRYKTTYYLNGEMNGGELKGDIIIKGAGDPTFGSWRYASATRNKILQQLINYLKEKKVNKINGNVVVDISGFETQTIPGVWIWDDIGNYYGAGESGLNWNENQYDLFLRSGKNVGDSVFINGTEPALQVYSLINELKAGKKGSGDNAYIYLPPYSVNGFVRGTIEPGESNFRISGSFPDPSLQFVKELEQELARNSIVVTGEFTNSLKWKVNGKKIEYKTKVASTYYSPTLDSVAFWFLRKSINLYGEALIKTLAYEKQGYGNTDSGVNIVKRFWKEKGLDEEELNIYDGSGLSPMNRLTTHAQVEVLKYAKSRDWFPYFYDALPEYNGMKMKSGTINDVKGFCGYQQAKDGHEYIFSILVNNYNGRSSGLVSKMYKVLDVLK